MFSVLIVMKGLFGMSGPERVLLRTDALVFDQIYVNIQVMVVGFLGKSLTIKLSDVFILKSLAFINTNCFDISRVGFFYFKANTGKCCVHAF